MAEPSTAKTDWVKEAKAVMNDIRPHVAKVHLSTLPSTTHSIYLNLTTLENNDFCVELTQEGFHVVGEKYDTRDIKGKYVTFETPYTMLNNLSPAYRDSFGQQLIQKLTKLREMREKEEEEEKMKKGNDEES